MQLKTLSLWSFVCVVLSSFRATNALCSDPEIPRDGWRSSPKKHSFNTGDTVHYYCKANYTLSGAPKVLCLSDGIWDRKPPLCIDPCGTCDNGGLCVHQTAKNKFLCVCKPGYRGDHCHIPYCRRPDKVANGGYYVVAPTGRADYDVNSRLMFHCDIGYRLNGKNNIECILVMNGVTWSSPFPVCERRRCRNPFSNLVLSNGQFRPRYSTYSIGDVVTFSCNVGFELHGASSVRCQVSGLWTAVAWPRCVQKHCPSPPTIPHGKIIYGSDHSTGGSTVRYTCMTSQGFYLYGSQSQTCVADSNGNMIWTPRRPQCISRLLFEQYCAQEGKTMSTDSIPRCVRKTAVFGDQSSVRKNTSIDTLTIVTGTAGGLLGFLLVIIAFVICQRRRLVRRMRLAATRRARTAEDERMLIYCSNDFHFFLPSYDEAMRSRPAEPPPFETVVDGNTETQTNQDPTSEENQTASIANQSTNQSNDEHEYEAIENVISVESIRSNVEEPVYGVVGRQPADENVTEIVAEQLDAGSNEDLRDTQLDCQDEIRSRSNSISSTEFSVSDENQPLC